MRDKNKRAYAESLRIDMKRDSVVSTPKSSHTGNITTSNLTYIENNNESIPNDDNGLRLMNERLRKAPLEPDKSQGLYIISVRHTSLGLVQRLFDRESLTVDVYKWVGSLCPYPKYFELRGCPNKVADSKEKVEACEDVLFMFPDDSQVVPTESSELHEKDDSVYHIGDEEADRFFESFKEPYGLEKDSITVDGSCKCNLKKIIQDEIEHLQLRFEDTIRALCYKHPDRFWRILFKQKIDFLSMIQVLLGQVKLAQTGEDFIANSFDALWKIL